MTDAFRVVSTESPRDVLGIRAQLKQLRADRLEAIGTTASDWADYCKRRGEILGIDTAIAICDSVIKEM